MKEIWKPVVGYEGWYEVSNKGRVYSHLVNRALTPAPDRYGYLRVGLRYGGKSRTLNVHCLVAAAFLGSRPRKLVTRHLNGIITDNVVTNLEYATVSRNMQDMKWHGTRYVLRPREVVNIKYRLRRGIQQLELAREYRVSQATISDIKCGRTHKDIP